MQTRIRRGMEELEEQAKTERVGLVIRQRANPWPRRVLWLAVGIGAVVLGVVLFTSGFPASLTVDSRAPFDAFSNWAIDNQRTHWLFTSFLVPLKDGVNAGFDQLVLALSRLTWVGVVALVTVIAGLLAGWRMAILAATGFVVMGVLGLWEASLQTLALILFAVTVCLVLGIPLGIWAGRHPGVERALRPVLDAMQTVPAFAYLVPLVLLFSIGTTTALIATVAFALPPVVRLTSLGMRMVPPTSLEVGTAFGTTSTQSLRKIQLPLAKPSIMLGVNQTIMMALGMVVIAASVGFGGLGREVLNGLQSLDVGQALAGGLAIVALAIVLDRVTYAWSRRDRARRDAKMVRLLRWSVSRRIAIVVGVAVVLVAVVVGRQVLRQQDFPTSLVVGIADPVNTFVDGVIGAIGGITQAMSDAMVTYALQPLKALLLALPWWMIAGGAAAAGYAASRRVGLAVLSFLCVAAIGVLGMWEPGMDTLSQVVVAVVSSVVIAIPLGIWSSQSDRVQRILKPAMDVMQTMPQFVYLVPVIALFNVGRVPGVIAALIYALPPGIRLTDLGIRSVPADRVEAATAFGATRGQTLRKVQLPLARPSILLGVNQTVIMVLSVVIIAGLIGGGGLGLEVVRGLNHDRARGMVAGICILLLAIVIDRITQAMGQPPAGGTTRRRTFSKIFGSSRTTRGAADAPGVSMTPTITTDDVSNGKGEA